MKRVFLLVLACGMYISTFAQTEPIQPCCNIMTIDMKNNIVVARDIATGRLYQFRADASDMKVAKLNDAVNVSAGKVTSISGAKRTYVTVRPEPIQPCCSIVSVQPDPIAPCCNAVTIKNTATNKSFTVSVPKQIAATLRPGQAASIDTANNLVIVQSSYASSNGQMNSYGYPATSGNSDNSPSETKDNEKWVVERVRAKSGTGKLFVSLPKGTEWDMTIYAAGSDKVLSNTMLTQTFILLPGSYDIEVNKIRVNGVPVEKGNETRIKAGVLDITNATSWTLYDEAKTKVLINSLAPKERRGLPVGRYVLTIMNQDQDIEIKDGETVVY